MKVWNCKIQEEQEEPKEIENFKKEIVEVMKKYNLSISHEDTHGGFIIEKYDEYNIKWFNDASIYF